MPMRRTGSALVIAVSLAALSAHAQSIAEAVAQALDEFERGKRRVA